MTAGVTDLISVSAVGSLREDLPPGHFVLVDQFIDRTFAREKSFFGTGCVAHVSVARPVAPLVDHLAATCADLGLPHQRGGTYMTMEGPQFSTLAESEYRAWGCDVIGMTNMPEATGAWAKSPMPSPWSPITIAGIRITRRSRSNRSSPICQCR